MSTRSRARQVAVQVLFQHDLNPDADDQQQTFIRSRLNKNNGLIKFTNQLVYGVRQNRDQLDSALQAAANNWSVPRMAATDRSILRLAVFELLFSDTPPAVVINESIELAKRFGSNQSAGFVNGILDRVLTAKSEPATESVKDATETSGEETNPSSADSSSVSDEPEVV